ncbi:MAG: hypothetical protein KatS3mg078_2037 [Deltaproteobacteria bacterium]|nr:MAG: hypothetical protein KatS3mg078_2037 [Deltaproteobacteria bacterium]
MAVRFVVFRASTGEVEADCGVCGIYTASNYQDFLSHDIPDDHGKKILAGEEQIDFDCDAKRYQCKIDTKKAKILKTKPHLILS